MNNACPRWGCMSDLSPSCFYFIFFLVSNFALVMRLCAGEPAFLPTIGRTDSEQTPRLGTQKLPNGQQKCLRIAERTLVVAQIQNVERRLSIARPCSRSFLYQCASPSPPFLSSLHPLLPPSPLSCRLSRQVSLNKCLTAVTSRLLV